MSLFCVSSLAFAQSSGGVSIPNYGPSSFMHLLNNCCKLRFWTYCNLSCNNDYNLWYNVS